jgi:glycosyltransferase involved in cell wall biosynthesis
VSEFVERAIRSILVQTYTSLEIWIIDDASTDDSLSKIKLFTDKRIRIISFKENTKKIGAVNDVLTKINGQFICFQDADDYSVSDRIEKQIGEFNKDKNLGICFTNYRYENDKHRQHAIALSNDELKDEFCRFWDKNNKQLGATVCATMMIAKDVFEKTGGYHPYFKGRVGEDIHWIYRILKNSKGICIDEPLYHYTLRNESLTGLQLNGKNAKAVYAWPLISSIIYKDIVEGIDVLAPEQIDVLRTIELEACEKALVSSIQNGLLIKTTYEKSTSYRLGKKIISLFNIFRK